LAESNIATYSMPLEVYLQSGIVRGMLVTNQDRLSNHLILRESEEIFSLRDAELMDLRGKPMGVDSAEYLVYMRQVFLIADLSPQFRANRSELEHLYVKKEQNRALLGVGPFWIEGTIHLLPGRSIHDLLMAKTRFVPVTNASLLDRGASEPRTYLLNRTQVGCLTTLGDD
jgi:hypothetical protein